MSLRDRIAATLEQASQEDLDDLVKSGLFASKEQYVDMKCKGCGQLGRYLIPIPDPLTRAKIIATYLDQGHGKPAETKKIEAQVDLRKRLEEMTDDELALIASGALA